MALSIRRRAASIVFPVATQPGRSGTDAPQSLSGSLLTRTRYRSFFIASPLGLVSDLRNLPKCRSLSSVEPGLHSMHDIPKIEQPLLPRTLLPKQPAE